MSPPLDSLEGMTALATFARAHRYVLSPYHEAMAELHGVSLDGITIARPLPPLAPQPQPIVRHQP